MSLNLRVALVLLVTISLMSCDYLSNKSKKLDCNLIDSTKDQSKLLVFEGQAGSLTINASDKLLSWISNIEPSEIIFLENFKSLNNVYSAENLLSIDWTDGKQEKILRTISIDRANLLMTYRYSSNETNIKKILAERKYQCNLADNRI